MKKLVMKLLVSALAVFVVFGTKAAITNAYDAPTAQAEECVAPSFGETPQAVIVNEANVNNTLSEYGGYTLWELTNAYILGRISDKCKPGSILKAGNEISFADVIYDYDDIIFQYYYNNDSSVFDIELSDEGDVSTSNVPTIVSALVGQEYDRVESNKVTINTAGSYSYWKVAYVIYCYSSSNWSEDIEANNYLYVILIPYEGEIPDEDTPNDEVNPVNVECTLVKSGNTTRWLSPEGKVVWTITEEADKITADLTDWAAVNADGVKAWAASGKALSITYKYNGYTVTINVPAGELTDTGAEWYGPEYLAAVNQKYVVVKDSTGLVVPNDRIYKK